jgi:hypothetical protein
VIRALDTALLSLLRGEAKSNWELNTADLSVAAPQASWRGRGTGLALNVYLAAIDENRDLRSNERRLRFDAGSAEVTPFPPRIDCTYVISAWNKATPVTGTDQELQEHRLLGQALWVLQRNPVLPRAYLTGLLAAQEFDPPVISARPDFPGSNADFWNALDTFVRPAISCRVTIALDLELDAFTTIMTTARLELDGEERLVFGGAVLDATSGSPIRDAGVRLVETDQAVLTDGDGRFVLDTAAPGPYTIEVRASGYVAGGGPVVVPSPTGAYDFALTPL